LYEITDVMAKEQPTVTVRDQIIKEPISITPRKLRYFCNPTDKNDEKRKDMSAHLAWYPCRRAIPEHAIIYVNQMTGFLPATLKIDQLWALLVPTEKIEKDSKFPEKLDHYLCYKVNDGSNPRKKVALVDQFQSTETETTGPIYFCVPCSKNNQPIKNEKDHLTVYNIGSGPEVSPDKNMVKIDNQFKEQRFKALRQLLLFVPTEKLAAHRTGVKPEE
jgi:hypothetical protein